MSKRHIRVLLIVVAFTLLASAVPAVAGESIERPIQEELSGHLTGIELSPNFPDGLLRWAV